MKTWSRAELLAVFLKILKLFWRSITSIQNSCYQHFFQMIIWLNHFDFNITLKQFPGFFLSKKHSSTCSIHESGYVFQPKSTFVDFEGFVYSGFSIVVMERRIQDDVFPLFIRVKGPVIQVFLFPGLFVGISIVKPEKLAGFSSIEYINSVFLK